jgi:SAM-dependent methyltransferase/uncharacterized protein YbaR (Trm112 family)
MHPKFLHLFRCPETGEPLALDAEVTRPNGIVWHGTLRTASGKSYPIVRGVPRFVGEEQGASGFGSAPPRWRRARFEPENVNGPMSGETTRLWEHVTGVTPDHVHGKTILDFGCRSGRFLDVVRRKGGLAVGIDPSAAVDFARRNVCDDVDVLIVQGDLFKPPFRPDAFDGGFSIDVLHHTRAPATALAALVRCVREGGWVSCCVQPNGDVYDLPSVARLRRVHLLLKPLVGDRFALAYSYLAAYLLAPLLCWAKQQEKFRGLAGRVERDWLASLWRNNVRRRLLDTFDAITPAVASTHTTAEVREWFRRAGCAGAAQTPWCPTSLTAVRLATSPPAAVPVPISDSLTIPTPERLAA